MLAKGYVQLYTGDGKGKTTAALGLALRAAGDGLKTIMLQFMKGQPYSELNIISKLGGLIEIEQHGSAEFCRPDQSTFAEHYRLCRKGLQRAQAVIQYPQYDLVILDEIVTALLFKLVSLEEIVEIIHKRPMAKELILTGRRAPQELIALCDLVTEMQKIKHYYDLGVIARRGIES